MENFLGPAPIGEGELMEQWEYFKREFHQYLVADGKDSASNHIKLAICLRAIEPRAKDMHETMTTSSVHVVQCTCGCSVVQRQVVR